MGLGFPEITILLIAVVGFALMVAMFVHAITNKRITDIARIVWIIAIVFFPLLASVAYYFVEYDGKFSIRQRTNI